MIKIKKASEENTEALALLGRITYVESHGHYIANKKDLFAYTNDAFSVAKTRRELNDSKNLFYIIYANDLPVGYTKLVLNVINKNVASQNNCYLERIYILNDFIPLKIGAQLLHFLENKAIELKLDTIWLSVYIKNKRAIKFYQKNEYKKVGELNFKVSGKAYENLVFSKEI